MAYHRVTVSGGAAVNVFDSGGSGRPLLFLHGNSCDHTFFEPQLQFFGPARRVLAPDLRGHGASDKPEGGYSYARLAQDVADILAALDVVLPTAVGHSMGGMLIFETSLRYPGLLGAAACLDTALFPPAGRPSRVNALLEGLKSQEWRSYFLRYFEPFFEPTDDPARKQAILERMLATPQHVVVSLFEQWRTDDAATAVKAWRLPLLYVSATRQHTDPARLRALCPQAMTGQVVASGHFLTLEVPDQVNAMLARFLRVNAL